MTTQDHDPRDLTFSQAQGLEPLPTGLALGEFPEDVRNRVWNVFYATTSAYSNRTFVHHVIEPWSIVLRDVHDRFFIYPLDEFSSYVDEIIKHYKPYFQEHEPFNKVFDLLLHIMRHQRCPAVFTAGIKKVFEECRMAYIVDTDRLPTICPAATEQEGEALQLAFKELMDAQQNVAYSHLQEATDQWNQGKWEASVVASVKAVESVAKHVSGNDGTLSDIIKVFRNGKGPFKIHPTLLTCLDKTYAYRGDRAAHGKADPAASVGSEEALALLGVCASFCTFLLSKHRAASAS